MTLRGEVVDLGRPDLLHQPDQVGRIRHVAIVQEKRHIAGVRVFVEMIDARGVERRRPPLDAMDRVAEAKQVFGEIGAILAGDASNQRNAPLRIRNRHVHSNNAPRPPKSSRTTTNRNTLRWTGRLPSVPWTQAGRPKPLSCPPSPKQIGPGQAVNRQAAGGLAGYGALAHNQVQQGRLAGWPEYSTIAVSGPADTQEKPDKG